MQVTAPCVNLAICTSLAAVDNIDLFECWSLNLGLFDVDFKIYDGVLVVLDLCSNSGGTAKPKLT